MHYNRDFGIECRIARFHNIYGPYGTWKGGREKAPAAFCRKVSAQQHLRRRLLLAVWLQHSTISRLGAGRLTCAQRCTCSVSAAADSCVAPLLLLFAGIEQQD
jgi:hypothetical protein